jgi:drug/metabolite transporter (DMT)-like permease
VLIIVRPGSGLDPAGLAFLFCAVAGNTAYQLLSRILAGSERTIALLFYVALVGTICFGLALPLVWDGQAPTGLDLLLLLSLGVYGGLGHFLFTAAFRHAPASLLAPLSYFQLGWAGLLGWLVFGQVPDALTVLGMSVIAASGLMTAIKSRQSSSSFIDPERPPTVV